MYIRVSCNSCDRTNELDNINEMDWKRYIDGELVQNVWPDLSINTREILIGARTGCYTCPACWDAIFADMEDES